VSREDGWDHGHDPFDPIRYKDELTAFGHEPTDDGRCKHRWRNRQNVAVTCPFLEGFRLALAVRQEPAINVERLQRIEAAASILLSAVNAVMPDDSLYRCPHTRDWLNGVLDDLRTALGSG
jgi:hypothetical protein